MSNSYDNSPRGNLSIATSYSGSVGGGGLPPPPPQLGQPSHQLSQLNQRGVVQQQQQQQGVQPQLSLSKSGDTLASNPTVTPVGGGVGGRGSSSRTNNNTGRGSINSATADTSVLLGLEELERQQADLEKRRADNLAREVQKLREKEIRQYDELQKRNDQRSGGPSFSSSGLPPLAPMGSNSAHGMTTSSSYSQHQREQYGTGDEYYNNNNNNNSHVRRRTANEVNVPSQIHLSDEDEDTALSSDIAGKDGKDSLKRVTSIEKIGKLRGQMSVVS